MKPRAYIPNGIIFIAAALVFFLCVEERKCFQQRARYLLGIVYNGYFKNTADTSVYLDYLKRHHTTHDEFQKTL